MNTHNPVFCALDTSELAVAIKWANHLMGSVGGMKLGLEFFGAQGPAGVRAVADTGMPIFLDLKFHDIPQTVAGAISSVTPMGPAFITIHTQGGRAMMEAAAEAATKAAQAAGVNRPNLLGVTVLTSLDEGDLGSIGVESQMQDQVIRLAELAQQSGLDGIVCSPLEIAAVRQACGPDLTLMVPGIRPAGVGVGDQKRVMTPEQALAAGANHLVIGRAITGADDPAAAAQAIATAIAA